MQRKVLTPNDFHSLTRARKRLLQSQAHYEEMARTFEWKFTQDDLHRLLAKLSAEEETRLAA